MATAFFIAYCVLMVLVYVLLGAIMFRGRGGVFNELITKAFHLPSLPPALSTQEGRIIYAVGMASWITFHAAIIGASLPGWSIPALAVAFFVGAVLPYFTADRGGDTLLGFTLMTLRGPFFVAAALPLLWYFGLAWLPLAVMSMFLGMTYYIGNALNLDIHDLRGVELGEALFGAMLGLGVLGL